MIDLYSLFTASLPADPSTLYHQSGGFYMLDNGNSNYSEPVSDELYSQCMNKSLYDNFSFKKSCSRISLSESQRSFGIINIITSCSTYNIEVDVIGTVHCKYLIDGQISDISYAGGRALKVIYEEDDK